MKLQVIAAVTLMLLSALVATRVKMVAASEPYVLPAGYQIEMLASGLDGPFGMVFDSEGNLYVANEGVPQYSTYPGTTVSRISSEGVVSAYASGFMGPSGLEIDSNNNLYVSDDTSTVVKVAPNGEASVVATDLGNPNALAFDESWNLFVANHGDGRIFRITPEGETSVFAGGFWGPQALAFDEEGRLYTSDHSGRIFIVTPGGMTQENHVVFAELPSGYQNTQGGLTFDAEGNLYMSSCLGAVFKVSSEGNISPFVAGFESEADGSAAYPRGLAVDQKGRLYITEFGSGVIWRVTSHQTAYLDIDPDTLNLRSKGQWITAYIEFPKGYNAADIDASTIVLNGTIQPVLDPKYGFVTNSSEYLVDHNNDGILERMVKFDRDTIQLWIYQSVGTPSYVTLSITGELFDGTPFEGTDTISVLWTG